MTQKQAMPNQAQNKAISTKKPMKKTFVKKSIVQTKKQAQNQPVKSKNQILSNKKITPNMFGGTKKQAPTTVKVSGILYYIFAGILLIGGIFLFFLSNYLMDLLGGGLEGFLGTILWWIMPVVLIAFTVLFFFIARGLFKLQKWAKILAIIFACLGIIAAIYSLTQITIIISEVITLVITGYILYSLLIDKASRQAFI